MVGRRTVLTRRIAAAGTCVLALAAGPRAHGQSSVAPPSSEPSAWFRVPVVNTARPDTAQVARLRDTLTARSPLLAARRSALAAARARLRATGFAPPATLAFEAEEVPGGFDLGSAGSLRLDLSRPFLTGGRSGARRTVAQVEVDDAELALQAARQRLGAELEAALLRALGTGTIAGRMAAQDSLLALAGDALRTRFAVGGARYVDVLRLRTERLRVQADRAAVLAEARVAYRQLLALAGLDAAEGGPARALLDSVVAEAQPTLLRAPLPTTPSPDSVLRAAAAIARADLAVRRAGAERRLTLAEQNPSLLASVGIQRFSDGVQTNAVGPTLGFGVSLPFTAGRANRLARAAADTAVATAEAERVAITASVRGRIAAAVERYEAARERLAIYDRALLTGAHEERESALLVYQSGEFSLLELLDFERALAQSEIGFVRTRIEAAQAFADLLVSAAGEEAEPTFALRPAEPTR